jgi:FAD-dependent urate hydroxylase
MKVTVVGGGMGGLALAALLSRTGEHHVQLLEQSEGYGQAGYGIGLYPLGAVVYNAIGQGKALRDRSVVLKRYEVNGPDAKPIQSVDLATLLTGYGPMLGVTRSDMIDLLVQSLPADMIQFGVRAERADLVGDKVVVTTGKHGKIESDIVVAADGVHSALRQSVFGEVEVYDTGFHAWMWWAPLEAARLETVSEYWGPSAFVGLYPMRKFVNVAVGIPKEISPDPHGSTEEIIATLKKVVAEHAPAVAALPHLWEVAQGKPFLWPMTDVRAPAITAFDHRLAFVGDSGVGFLPTAGVGASNALRSGAALAYELSLASEDSAQAAVRRWEQRVHKLVKGNQADSRQLAKVMMVKHPSASALINTLMKHMPVTFMTNSIIKSMQEPF